MEELNYAFLIISEDGLCDFEVFGVRMLSLKQVLQLKMVMLILFEIMDDFVNRIAF